MDIATLWDPANGRGDWAMAGVDLVGDGTLKTAVLISLFTDAEAGPDDIIPDAVPGQPPNRRGWWADPQMGSKIWLRLRSKLTPQLAITVRKDILNALQWLIDDGVAASVDAVMAIVQPNTLTAVITIIKSGGDAETYAYDWAWKGVV